MTKKIDNFYIQFQTLLILPLPLFLASGPFLPDFIISLSAILFLSYSLLKKNFYYFKNKFFLFFFLWYIYLFLNSLFSNHILNSFEASFFYIRFGVFSVCVYFIIKNNNNFLKYFNYSFIFTFVFIILDAYVQYFYGKNILGYEYNGVRLGGLTGDELILGSYISRLFPIMFGLAILFFKKNTQIYFLFTILILADIVIYLSGERSAFFYLFLFTIILIFLSANNRYLRIFSFIISILIIVFISFYDVEKKERMLNLTVSEINGSNNTLQEIEPINFLGKKFYAFSKYHTAFYSNASKIFIDNPIFGIGPKNFRIVCAYEKYYTWWGCASHPHHTYIQLLSETGLVGTIPIIILFIIISLIFLDQLTIRRLNYLKNDTYLLCLLIAIYISLWPLVPTGNFFNNWMSSIYFLPIGFILAHLDKKNISYKS